MGHPGSKKKILHASNVEIAAFFFFFFYPHYDDDLVNSIFFPPLLVLSVGRSVLNEWYCWRPCLFFPFSFFLCQMCRNTRNSFIHWLVGWFGLVWWPWLTDWLNLTWIESNKVNGWLIRSRIHNSFVFFYILTMMMMMMMLMFQKLE